MRVSLFSLKKKDLTFKEYSNFPPVIRDLSIVIDGNVNEEEIEKAIRSTNTGGLLKKLKLYDIYVMGEDKGKKSYTFTLEFRADDRTLTNDEVNVYQEKIIANLKKNLKAELRT
jgi:phenylalanyl-tRNA synthetase beta chain